MFVEGKTNELSTAISYHEHKRSAKFTASGGGRTYCVPKSENAQYKVENGIQSNTGINSFRFPKSPSSWKQWLEGISDTAEKEELINLLLTVH